MDRSNIDDIIRIFQVVIIPLLGWVGWMQRDIREQLKEIRDQLRLLNGRLIKQETWAKMHDEVDKEHHASVGRELDLIRRMDRENERHRT